MNAIEHGYDVRDELATAVAAGGMPAGLILQNDNEASWHERENPSALAFAVLDKVMTHVATLRRPKGVTIEVSRVVRFRGPTEYYRTWRTAVVVSIKSLTTRTRIVVFSAE